MSVANLVSEEVLPADSLETSHPTDSSRLLLGLMALSRTARNRNRAAVDVGEPPPTRDPLTGIIDRGVLKSILATLQYRDANTVRHSRRVALLATGLAGYLGWDGRQIKLLEVASLLHDVGKIGVPDNILFKPGQLSSDETELMALHHNIGVDVLQACRVDTEVLEIVVQSNSFFKGEPGAGPVVNGKQRQGARILAVADAYDSLSTDQIYREGRTHPEILKVLREAAGAQFDGSVVDALDRWTARDGLPFSGSGLSPEFDEPEAVHAPHHAAEALEASSLCHIFSYLYVLESLYDGFYLVDSDLRFVVWSMGAQNLLGRRFNEMQNQPWTSGLLKPADRYGRALPENECPLNRVIEAGRPTMSELRLERADGETVEVEQQSVPLFDRAGNLQGVAEIFRNLSRDSSRPREFRKLKMAASTDALTSVANRGELEARLVAMINDFNDSPRSANLSVIFMDIDFFKRINDTCSHSIGDEVLVDTSRLLQHETYSGELVARYGGEEFVILCPETALEPATRRAERLRTLLSRTPVSTRELKVTASFGVAQAEPGDTPESLLRRADKALYISKESGRNRTTSLTVQELLESEAEQSRAQDQDADPFECRNTFKACVAAEMIVYKLGGFVREMNAKVVAVSPERAVLRLGSGGLFKFWGSSDARRPVELEIQFEEDAAVAPTRRIASKQMLVNVLIRPRGWVRKADVFQSRAKRAIKDLRSYFVAE